MFIIFRSFDPNKRDHSIQTDDVAMVDRSGEIRMPEITIEDIMSSDEDILIYTGLPDYNTFNAFYQTLIEHGADKLLFTYDDVDENVSRRNIPRKLRLVDEFLLVMMRLRLGLLVKDLS